LTYSAKQPPPVPPYMHSNHPREHKAADYRYHIKRTEILPLSEHKRERKKNIIKQIATDNGYPQIMIDHIQNCIHKLKKPQTKDPTDQKWVTFTYFNPEIRKITNIFRNTKLRIAFRLTNTLSRYFTHAKTTKQDIQKSGVCEIICHTCGQKYVGQTSWDLNTRFLEHRRYIRNNNPRSAYALHILNNRHEYGPASNAIKLIRHCSTNIQLIYWENFHTQHYHRNGKPIQEQTTHVYNILYNLATYACTDWPSTTQDTAEHRTQTA
jgi:hypothetical protein